VLHEINFPLKKLLMNSDFSPLRSPVIWIYICASLNHCKKMKVESSRLIPQKLQQT